MAESGYHALIFGASGLAGWAVVDQILENYPKDRTFSKVTALVNRPLKVEDSYWPTPSPSRPKLQLVSGINLTEGTVEEFTTFLKQKVEDMESITHVYYFAYKQENDPDLEVKINVGMLERVIGAVNVLSPRLKFIVSLTGTKGYGVHLPSSERPFKAPFTESMRRLPPPYGDKIWYNAFQDMLTSASADKSWTWCEVRPDAIVGFVPNGSTFNITAHWATYLSTYALAEGKGAKVPYPGTTNGFESLFNDASADILARVSIFASLNPDTCGDGQLFNVADQAKATRMVERWPTICGYFGLEGVGPVDEGKGALLPSKYIAKHKNVLEERGLSGIGLWGAEFLDSYGFYLDFDRQLSLDRIREKGFVEERDPDQGWFKAFDRFIKAGMIPGQS